MVELGAGNLISIAESGRWIADPRADVRRRAVLDRDGEEVGTVEDLLIDDEEQRVRMLRVERGGFLGIGAEHFLVPVDAVASVTEDAVHIDRERTRLTDVPGYDPEVADEPAHYADVYGFWGYPAHWAPGYGYPGFPGP
jgi:sporulation protein YlmC with PRC-barrel domain